MVRWPAKIATFPELTPHDRLQAKSGLILQVSLVHLRLHSRIEVRDQFLILAGVTAP
ncbi:MAG: hypothetical protein ABJQ70_17465 [Roseobacter sp.]